MLFSHDRLVYMFRRRAASAAIQRCLGLSRHARVPVSSLFENLESEVSVTEFVDAFEGVTIEQVRSVLEHAARSALAPA